MDYKVALSLRESTSTNQTASNMFSNMFKHWSIRSPLPPGKKRGGIGMWALTATPPFSRFCSFLPSVLGSPLSSAAVSCSFSSSFAALSSLSFVCCPSLLLFPFPGLGPPAYCPSYSRPSAFSFPYSHLSPSVCLPVVPFFAGTMPWASTGVPRVPWEPHARPTRRPSRPKHDPLTRLFQRS